MKSLLVLALMFFSLHSMGATHRLNFSDPVRLKKIVMKKSMQLNFIALYKAAPADKKLISKN